jgi:DNA-binding LacI/PurR family transcriptional regulator
MLSFGWLTTGAGVLMTKVTIAIAALAAMNTAAHSATTVDQWIALCSKGISPSCESYVLGVADAAMAFQATRPQLSTTCIPSSVTGKDLVTLVLPYAQGQPPALRQLLAAALLMDVFREAFPCRQK